MHDPARNRRLLFFSILILAAGLRFFRIADSSFWLDEFCSVECSTGRGLAHVALPRNQWLPEQRALTSLSNAPPWWSIWTSLSLDNHPPLYFLLLRFWRDAFGESDLAARMLSVFISLAGICFFYDAIKLSLGHTTALWAAFLASVAMSQIHFAQEARGYALLGTLGMAACAAFVRIEKSGLSRPRIAALTISVLGMLLTHYFALASLTALGLYALLTLRGPQRRTTLITLTAATLTFAIIWGPWMLQQRPSFAINNAWQIQTAEYPWHALQQSTILPVRWCSETFAAWQPPLTIVLGLAAYSLAVLRFFPYPILARTGRAAGSPRPPRQSPRRLWTLWMVLPAVLVTLIDLIHSTRLLDQIRYTLAASWGLYVLICGLGKSWTRHILPAAVAAICLSTVSRGYSVSRDSEVLAKFLQSHVHSDDAVIFASAGRDDWYAGAMYLGVCHYAAPLPAPVMLLTQPPTGQILESLHSRRTVWLIAGSNLPSEQILPGLKPTDSANFPDIGQVWELHGH